MMMNLIGGMYGTVDTTISCTALHLFLLRHKLKLCVVCCYKTTYLLTAKMINDRIRLLMKS